MKFSIAAIGLLAITFADKVNCDLKTSETAYSSRYPYHTDYDHDSGHDSYGKQSSSYGNHGHGAYGALDKYGDNGYGSTGLEKYSKYGSKGAHGSTGGAYGHKHGYGLYSRNRGYGYEKHYAYDKELSTKEHGADHGHHHADAKHHDNHGSYGLTAHDQHGYNKYGSNDKYGKHGYGRYGHLLGAYGNKGYSYNKYPPAKPYVAPYLGRYSKYGYASDDLPYESLKDDGHEYHRYRGSYHHSKK